MRDNSIEALNEQSEVQDCVVAPASRMSPDVAIRVPALAQRLYPDRAPEIVGRRALRRV